MADVAIKAEGLGKRYRIGAVREPYYTLRDAIVGAVKAPARLLSRLGRGGERDTIWALKDVSFEVKRGEVVGVIGRNGAGKSTLLKVLSRITKPTEGRAEILGRVGSLLEVGTGFHPELTGRENIFLNGSILGMKRREIKARFDEIVAFAEVEKFIDTPVKRYSSGMQVRLAFAVAAHLEPEILLVDEVLAVGDAAFQKKCLGKMGDVAREGRTVVVVSHNMATIEGLCKRCVLLDRGRLAGEGESAEVVQRYLNAMDLPSVTGMSPVSDLSSRVNEYLPTGAPIITQLTLFGDAGKPTVDFAMGSPIAFGIRLSGLESTHSLAVGVILKSRNGARVGGHNTSMAGFEFPGRPPGQAIDLICTIEDPRLIAGRYAVALSVVKSGGRIDFVEDAAYFDVSERDVYGTGYPISAGLGVVYLNGRWRIGSETDSSPPSPSHE